jgi:multicomponent Na+:H+ antiporter subunit D
MWAPAVLLLAGGLAVGVAPGLAAAAERFSGQFVDQGFYLSSVLQAGPAVAAPALRAASGPGGFDLSHGLGAAAGAVLLAALALWRDSLPPVLQSAGRHLVTPPVNALRSLHTGVANDYVAWIVAGVATYGTILALTVR